VEENIGWRDHLFRLAHGSKGKVVRRYRLVCARRNHEGYEGGAELSGYSVELELEIVELPPARHDKKKPFTTGGTGVHGGKQNPANLAVGRANFSPVTWCRRVSQSAVWGAMRAI
jgi:hypothetical protein